MSETRNINHNFLLQQVHTNLHYYFKLMILGVLFLINTPSLHAEVIAQDSRVTAHDGTELGFTRYPADGTQLIIWIAPGYGLHERSVQIAKQLASNGVEVWQIDLAEALFLPHSTDQLRALSGEYVADMIKAAFQQTNKKITLCSQSYGAIPLLRGVRQWQISKTNSMYLNGAILFSPDLYTTVPPLGLDPEYLPIVFSSNIPIVIFQEGMRGNRWHIDNLVRSLGKGGSKIRLKIYDGVTGLFFNDDNSAETARIFKMLDKEVIDAIQWLEKIPTPHTAVPMVKHFKTKGSGIDNKLKKFKGNFAPFAIDLPGISGELRHISDYRNKLTIVNFWASWCSPCVQEIPSLNRLREKITDIPLELVSINYAENVQTIRDFMRKVDVRYPVLLDSTGQISAKWKVVTFPSTYIIGADGKIHFAVNAAIEWDTPEVSSQLKKLYQSTYLKPEPISSK